MANDEELCQYLVEQEDSMDTECQGGSSGTQNVAVSVQNEPMECLDDSDEFLTALQQLTALAHQNSFTIHDVPYDVFSAISYQLQANGVCNVTPCACSLHIAMHVQAV